MAPDGLSTSLTVELKGAPALTKLHRDGVTIPVSSHSGD